MTPDRAYPAVAQALSGRSLPFAQLTEAVNNILPEPVTIWSLRNTLIKMRRSGLICVVGQSTKGVKARWALTGKPLPGGMVVGRYSHIALQKALCSPVAHHRAPRARLVRLLDARRA